MNKCLVCGHEWKFKKRNDCSTNNSRNCPKCQSYNWDHGNNVPCYCCNRNLLTPLIHHKNGDHFDNSKSNRIALCSDCHNAVHHNISKPKRQRKTGLRRNNKINKDILDKINQLKGSL